MILMFFEDDCWVVLWWVVVISFFSWCRVDFFDLNDGVDLFGWWVDSYFMVVNDKIGLCVWLLQCRFIMDDVFCDVVVFGEEVLVWFVFDGYVSKVMVMVVCIGIDGVMMNVVIDLLGDELLQIEIDDFWRVINVV